MDTKMKKRRDLEDQFVDLDEEFEEQDEDYDDYEEADDVWLPGRKIMIPVIIAVVILIIGVVLVIILTGKKKEQPAVETGSLSAKQADEPDTSRMDEGGLDAGEQAPDAGTQTEKKEEIGQGKSETDGREPEGQAPEESEESDLEESGLQESDSSESTSQDPQSSSMSSDQGTEVDVSELLSSGSVAQTDQVTVGIDVARYQGTIDWAQVAASGIDFAMVRVGYRADGSREICADTNARYNMQEAQKNGIKVGVYFFSTATTIEEAKAEAGWVADYIAKYQITYPVAYDCEGFDQPDSAQHHLTNAERTDIAIAFLQEIYNRGYTPMFYASMGELSGSAKWDTTRIEGKYKIWVSQYPSSPYPETAKSSYTGTHAMWQYTNRGTVAGIDRPVDVNVAYFGYEGTAEAQSSEAPEEAHADVEALMNFTEVNENVTAKDSTNLRNVPSQGEDSSVLYTLKNGETAVRTGVSDSGWSRLTYDGKTVYAVSSYLTTDLSFQAPAKEEAEGSGSGDGLKTKFADRNEQVTAKIEVNLRALPSVTNPDAVVTAVLHNGEYVTRTGINEEYGWSRVDYNGQTLYCISSYLTN